MSSLLIHPRLRKQDAREVESRSVKFDPLPLLENSIFLAVNTNVIVKQIEIEAKTAKVHGRENRALKNIN